MQGYFIFVFVVIVLVCIANITRSKGFNKLSLKRSSNRYMLFPGEEFKITTELDNNKWLPLSFLSVEEELPADIHRLSKEEFSSRDKYNYYLSSYSIFGHERVKRTYTARIDSRGVFFLRNIKFSLGDMFGFTYETLDVEDFLELVVYPSIIPFGTMSFNNNNLQGDNIIKRWIYKDTQYIKGIREYNVEDRMKDIHWKSSLRMDKLMVKDYDFTSDREVVIITNVQCGDPYWGFIDGEAVENSIDVSVALANECINNAIPVGMWTNAQLISHSVEFDRRVMSSLNSLKSIMELCARMDYTCRIQFSDFIKESMKYYNKSTIYVVITSFLNEECISFLYNLKRKGINIKIIDTSSSSSIPEINGIEKLSYRRLKNEQV